ncbi:MAG: 1-(5-phosphoribosyl)-5-((5-phosphoribosylamino)methylideneamino)imidazole-4-carboxamide isomerase, partial [Gammaproteobacteria bacterium]|nr:1-(5-phosphoribosyl)-5-((5-phosphoribosylamino)methylideneamino)imidazole-4-carboxamide isomerase [Gammaproteobacteria bacterium]
AALKAADEQAGNLLLGAITGRAIYAGTLDFQQGQALLDA